MADILLDEQSAPSTPAAGKGLLWVDTSGILMFKDDAGNLWGKSSNASVADQAGFAADTYVAGSSLVIPSSGVAPKTIFNWKFTVSKTAAGIATPIYIIRIGAAGTTADTARVTLTGPAQTAVIDIGTLNVMATVRNVGASGIIQAAAWWDHRGTAASSTGGTGFANDSSGHVQAASAAFDNSALAGLIVGMSINGGASAAWTMTQAQARADW